MVNKKKFSIKMYKKINNNAFCFDLILRDAIRLC